MEKKRQKIWTAIGVGIAIALLLYWLTLAIWIDDDTDPPMPPPVEETSNCFIQFQLFFLKIVDLNCILIF